MLENWTTLVEFTYSSVGWGVYSNLWGFRYFAYLFSNNSRNESVTTILKNKFKKSLNKTWNFHKKPKTLHLKRLVFYNMNTIQCAFFITDFNTQKFWYMVHL